MGSKIALRQWDVLDHLKTEEDIELYFDACVEKDPGDGSLIRAALGDIARARGMSQLARDTGLAREGLYKALSAEGNPEFATVMKVIKALGLKLHGLLPRLPACSTWRGKSLLRKGEPPPVGSRRSNRIRVPRCSFAVGV